MPQEKAEARKVVRAAQRQFERESDAIHRARRKAFAQAQKEGLSLREIGEEEVTSASPDPAERDGIERAVRDLTGVGLLRLYGDLVTPTRAAVKFHQLAEL